MNNKKIKMSQKKNLKILIEDFLERNPAELEKIYRKQRKKAEIIFSNVFQLLCDPSDDYHDFTLDELKKTILEWHIILCPLWKKIKSSFIDYRENVLSEREIQNKVMSAVNDPLSDLSEYKDNINYYMLPSDDRTREFKLKRSPIVIKFSFDSDKFFCSINGVRVVDNFLLQLKGAPADIFSFCAHCKKIIVITRKGKEHHPGCAAKAKQKERWMKDPEGCREKERNRYYERKSKASP